MANRSVAELEAELAVRRLEEALVEAKGTDDGPPRELKLELREARRAHRLLREGRDVDEGDAVAGPDSIDTAVTVEGSN